MGNAIRNETFRGLSKLTQLKTLSIWDSPIANSALVGIDQLSQLRFVQLRSTKVSDETLARLANLPQLDVMVLSRSQSITDQGIYYLKNMPLKQLRINDNPRITDTSAEVLGSFNNLTDLWLDGTSIGRKTVQQISQHRRLKLLVLSSDQFHMDDLLPLASNSLIQIHIKDRRSPIRDSMLTP